MAKWIYNGDKYKSIPVDWNEFDYDKYGDIYLSGYSKPARVFTEFGTARLIVYNPKWDKCFVLLTLGWHSNRRELKALIEDIYTKRIHWVSAKNLELVTKRK